MFVKLSLVAAFVTTMATLTFAASSLPAGSENGAAPVAVVAIAGVTRTAGSRAGTVALPAGVVPEAAITLMASL